MFSQQLFCENEPSLVVNLRLSCSVCNRFVVSRELKPGPRLLPAESASGLRPAIENYDRRGCDRKHQASLLLLGLWQKQGLSMSSPPNHSLDNIVQLKPAGVLSCNPIELQQKAWLATTLLLSPLLTHCFPPFFRPSSSFARNNDKDICALITYFSICLSILFLPFSFLLLVGLWLKWHIYRNVSQHFFVFEENFRWVFFAWSSSAQSIAEVA